MDDNIIDQPFSKLIEQASPAIESKKNELNSLGYEDVSNELIIDCLKKKIWRKERPKQIYKIVQDILNLKSSTYMSFISTAAHKVDDDLMSSITAIIGENKDKT